MAPSLTCHVPPSKPWRLIEYAVLPCPGALPPCPSSSIATNLGSTRSHGSLHKPGVPQVLVASSMRSLVRTSNHEAGASITISGSAQSARANRANHRVPLTFSHSPTHALLEVAKCRLPKRLVGGSTSDWWESYALAAPSAPRPLGSRRQPTTSTLLICNCLDRL